MTKLASSRCTLCREQGSKNFLTSLDQCLSEFLNHVRRPKPNIRITETDGGKDTRVSFCVSCRRLLVTFQELQQRLEEFGRLNKESSAVLAAKIKNANSLEADEVEAYHVSCDRAEKDELTHQCTSEWLNKVSTGSHGSVEELTSISAELAPALTIEPTETADETTPENDNHSEGSCSEELVDLAQESPWEPESSTRSTSTSESSSSVESDLSDEEGVLPPISPNGKGDASKDTSVRNLNPLEDTQIVQTTRDPLQKYPRRVYIDVTQESLKSFLYAGKYKFERTSFGYRCGVCDFQSTLSTQERQVTFENIRTHIRKHHEGGRQVRQKRRLMQISPSRFLYGEFELEKIGDEYICKLCNKGLRNLDHISDHMWRHRDKSEWICESCGKVLKTQQGLCFHKTYTHNEQRPPPQTCADCGKSYKTSGALKTHRDRVHLKRLCFTCAACGQQFFTKTELQGHEYVHTGEKTFECQICGKKFAKSASLNVHQLHHKGRKFTCDICEMEFTQAYSVTRHKNTAHPGWKKKS